MSKAIHNPRYRERKPPIIRAPVIARTG